MSDRKARARRHHRPRRAASRSLPSLMCWAIALIAVVLPAMFASAGATTGCGTYSFGFEGTRLLNDGISDVSGPYDIDLPAGVYTVTLVAHDHHDRQPGVGTQPGEQFVVELDSGYRSPPSTDIPDDDILTTTTFTGQVVAASATITVRHGGVPGINSVDVVCVGFTPEPSPQPVAPTPDAEPDPAVTPDPPVEPTVPGVIAPDPDAPDPGPADPGPIETPAQDIGDPVGIIRQPGEDPEPAPIEPEVLDAIEAPPVAPQLAITGPGEHAELLFGIGLTLLAAGALLVRRERRAGGQL